MLSAIISYGIWYEKTLDICNLNSISLFHISITDNNIYLLLSLCLFLCSVQILYDNFFAKVLLKIEQNHIIRPQKKKPHNFYTINKNKLYIYLITCHDIWQKPCTSMYQRTRYCAAVNFNFNSESWSILSI